MNQNLHTKSFLTGTSSKINVKKNIVSGLLVALTVALSGFSIPFGASKCFPVQHLINVIAGIFLGPFYSVSIAFCTSLIRNLIGTGSLLAFPGSMAGAFLSALFYQKTGKFGLAYLGETLGTGILGSLLCYPVARLLMGKDVALFFYVIPFLMSTICGTSMAAVITEFLRQCGLFSYLKQMLD